MEKNEIYLELIYLSKRITCFRKTLISKTA